MAENKPPPSLGPLDADVRPLQEALRDRYILEEIIGTGGMGVVWKARDVRHARTVAIKVMRPDIARAVGADRFQREIQIAARLMHPSIVTVIDSGEAAGTLYFVMSYVEGESLRSRLAREGAIPVRDAVRIATQLADALRHAHAAGIVHRDIKPENILLSEGHAWLVDFGVARAVATATDARLTSTGLIVGSPQYVSPEQARGEDEIDGRADIYSLGCVLYEMLTGRAPFEAKTLEAMLLGHMTKQPAPLRTTRSEIPPHVEKAVLVALAKDPAHRYQTGESFADALAGKVVRTRSAPVVSRRAVAFSAIGLGLLGALIMGRDRIGDAAASLVGGGAQLDTTRYVVLPFTKPTNVPDLGIEQRLSDALAAWQGVDVVEQSRIAEAQASLGPAGSATAARKASKRFNAGRVVTGSIAQVGDSLRLFVELGDGGRHAVSLAKARISVPVTGPNRDQIIAALEAALLFPGAAPECLAGDLGTRVKAAVHACDHAFSALHDGDLAIADRLFVNALKHDDRYARAALWLAQIRSWIVRKPPSVAALVQVSANKGASLTQRENLLLQGLRALEAGDHGQACQTYAEAVRNDSLDFVAWMGMGECRARDHRVVRDTESSSGWTFRSSYNAAIRAYAQAFRLKPMLWGGYRERAFQPIRHLLFAGTSSVRMGRALPPDTTTFWAYPSLALDTIAFVPLPGNAFQHLVANSRVPSITSAYDKQRDLFRVLARRWAESIPNDARAAEALAVAYELEGDRGAIKEIRRARSLLSDSTKSLQLAVTEFWLHIKFGLPDDIGSLKAARALADTLLSQKTPQSAADIERLIPVAVVIGRANLAARLAREGARASADEHELPRGVIEPARALAVFAAAGGPVDSLRRLDAELDLAIQNGVSSGRQAEVRRRLLTRSAMIAFPDYKLRDFDLVAKMGAYTEAQYEYSRNNPDSARRILGDIARFGDDLRPADRTFDGLFAQVALWDALGEPRRAAAILDPTLNAVRWSAPGSLDDIALAGSMVRSIRLRSVIARKMGERRTAERWEDALQTLWLNEGREQ